VEAAKLLLGKEPSSLDVTTSNGATALYLAATEPGMDRTVSRLLARGGTNVALLGNGSCPLAGAVHYSLESMVFMILNEGFDAVGRPVALSRANHPAATKALPQFLLVLVGAEGEDRRRFWSKCTYNHDEDVTPLHRAIGPDSVGAVSVLVELGASLGGEPANRIFNLYNKEKALVFFTPGCRHRRDPVRKAVVRRIVAGAAAFRAQSWVFPAEAAEADADATAAAAAVSAAGGGGKPSSALGMRIFRRRRRPWLPTIVDTCVWCAGRVFVSGGGCMMCHPCVVGSFLKSCRTLAVRNHCRFT